LTPTDGFEMLDECHRETVVALGTLKALAERLRLHGGDPQARALAHNVLEFFATTARLHHEDEERHVFPKLLASTDADIVQAVQRLQVDHQWIDADWRELSPLIDAVACGQSGYDIDVLCEGVEIFVALSLDHMALEESYVYPQARSRARAAERGEMGREMAARRRAVA
jgi:iron-sulfur cluster repair protein YtfE (RIC family)